VILLGAQFGIHQVGALGWPTLLLEPTEEGPSMAQASGRKDRQVVAKAEVGAVRGGHL
jgi:hypothetical protein